jgi:hypothetical protein
MLLSAAANQIDPNIKGVLKIGAGSGVGDYPFTAIAWYSNDGGYVTDTQGNKTRFYCNAISQIIYFDAAYYSGIADQYMTYRSGLDSREILITLAFPEILKPEEVQAIEDNKQKLVSLNTNCLKPYIEVLDSYIQQFKAGQRFVDGKWLSLSEDKNNHVYGPVSFQANNVLYDRSYIALSSSDDDDFYVLTSIGGDCINYASLSNDFQNFPKEVIEKAVVYNIKHLSETANVADAGPNLVSFIQQAETVGKNSQNMETQQKELSQLVMDVLIKNISNNDNRRLTWEEWPKLKTIIPFDSQQQINFYKSLLEAEDVTTDQCKEILTLAGSSDLSADFKATISNFAGQMEIADKLTNQMEVALIAFFSDPNNKLLLNTSATGDELAKNVNLGPDGDNIAKAINEQLARTSLPCVKQKFEIYQDCWQRLPLLQQLRILLVGGKLSDIEPLLSHLSFDAHIIASLTPGQQLVAKACAANVVIYNAQKEAVKKLLDEAESLKALGGQNAKALQDYKDAYKLNSDPAILEQIKNLNQESLGI